MFSVALFRFALYKDTKKFSRLIDIERNPLKQRLPAKYPHLKLLLSLKLSFSYLSALHLNLPHNGLVPKQGRLLHRLPTIANIMK